MVAQNRPNYSNTGNDLINTEIFNKKDIIKSANQQLPSMLYDEIVHILNQAEKGNKQKATRKNNR